MIRKIFVVSALFIFLSGVGLAQSTSFNYQGNLKSGGSPANGNFDLQFLLYDAVTGGSQLGTTVSANGVSVTDGAFSVSLDFGNQFPGAARFLEIRVQPSGGGGFTTLTPRQPISSNPYSIKSLSSDTATSAATATNATQLGGIAAGQYVLTGDSRLSDARNPLPGSANYIQNNTSVQAGSNFNISGNGVVGGSLTATNLVSNSGSSFGSGGSSSPGVYAVSGSGNAVYGYSSSGYGLAGSSGSSDAIYGEFAGNNSLKAAVRGVSTVNGFGVFGESPTNAGVRGISTSGWGVLAESSSNYGVYGISGSSVGVVGGGATGVFGAATGPGKLGLRADGTSWFHGDTTPLSAALTGGGTGIAIGTTSTNIGYIFAIDYGTFASKVLALNSPGGQVGIGTLAPDQTLSVNGNASKAGGGSWLTFSDQRLKNIKGRFAPGLAAVMQLQPLLYEYKKENALGIRSNGDHVGFSAQAVEKVIPEAVTINEKGYRLVNNDPIMWAMLNAIKEQETQIESQQRLINQQNAINKSQQADIAALRALVCVRNRRAAVCKRK